MSGVTEAISGLAGPAAYAVVGVLAALEAAAFVGLVLPGEVAMLVGGYLAYRGRVEVAPMMAAASAGAVAGYAVGYELGRHFGGRLRQSRLGRRVGEERWERAEAYLAQRGGKAILLGRFVGVLRALVPALAGTVRMPYRKFLAWNLLGGVAWASGFVLLGYVTGASYQRVERIAGQAGLFLLAVVVMVGGIVFAARWVASHPEQVRALGSRLLERPFVRRYRGQLEFVGRRFRPGRALGLSLTVQLVALGLGGWAFGAVLQDVLTGDELVVVDGPLLRYVADHREAWLTSTLKVVTHLGSSWVLIPVLVGVGGAALRRGMGWAPLATLALAFLGAVVLQDVVKFLVSRPRPRAASW